MNVMERKILWAAIEDYAGLWELVWELNTSFPQIPEIDRRSGAEAIVRSLLARGYVRLFERNRVGENEKLVPNERWEDLLRDEARWREPVGGATEILIAATDAGEEYYAAEASG